MTYIVTRNIIDTKDNNRFYEEGDTFPRKGFEVSKDRLAELIGKGVLNVKGEETPAPAPTEEEAPTEGIEEKPLEKLKVAELKELLEKAGVEYEADAKKADLVTLAQTIEGE